MNDKKENSSKELLLEIINNTLVELEKQGNIIICSRTSSIPANILYNKMKNLLPNNAIDTSELIALRSLVLHAIKDNRFFDWEMPTLTGLDAEGFARIAEKLPKG